MLSGGARLGPSQVPRAHQGLVPDRGLHRRCSARPGHAGHAGGNRRAVPCHCGDGRDLLLAASGLLYVFFTAAVVALVGSGFCMGLLGSDVLPEEYLQSGKNWSVYVACIALSCMVSSVAVIRYRQAMQKLLAQVAEQRDKLSSRNAELVQAMEQVKRLSGMLPICSACKKVRDDKGYWRQIESYVQEHSEAEFTHGICPGCMRDLYPEYCEALPTEGSGETPSPILPSVTS